MEGSYDDFARRPLLSSGEELALIQAIQAGDENARKRLVEANMRLVINIAKTYRNKLIPLEDLIQDGAIGLMQAAERFDPDRGFRFSTYATHWIRQAIGRAIDNKSKAIRLPAHVSQSLRKVQKERERIQRETGEDPTHDELAEAVGMSSKKLHTLLQSNQDTISLDQSVNGESGGVTLGGLIRDVGATGDPETLVLDAEVVYELQRILSELNEREQSVMRLRFKFDGSDAHFPLLQAIRSGDEAARERLRNEYSPRIRRIARMAHLRSWGTKPVEDLVLAGEAGLLQAAMRFTPEPGLRFSTYADHWIRSAISARIREA